MSPCIIMSEILQALGLGTLFVTFATVMEYKNPSPLTYEQRVAAAAVPEYKSCSCGNCYGRGGSRGVSDAEIVYEIESIKDEINNMSRRNGGRRIWGSSTTW
jgi:hypothetical protein